MNEERSEVLIDLLVKQATEGLTDVETAQLAQLESESGMAHDTTFERTAAAVGLIDASQDEQMPSHLRARLLVKAEEVFDERDPEPSTVVRPDFSDRKRTFWGWMGWAVAAAACLALVINIWLTRVQPRPEIAQVTPTPSPEVLSP